MPELTGWVEAFARSQRQPHVLAAWVDRTLHMIVDGMPELPEDLRPTVAQAIEQHWLMFLDSITAFPADDEPTFELVPAAAELAMETARRHLGLPVLLRAYRIAQDASWEFAIDVVERIPREVDRVDLLVRMWTRASHWFGGSVEISVLLHQQEAARIRQRGDARRYEVVAALLDGSTIDPTGLSAALGGYPVGGSHVALIGHSMTTDSIAALEPALLLVAGRVGSASPVLVRPGGRGLWAWAAASRVPDIDTAEIDADAVRVTVGGPALHLEGFVQAHLDARATQRVALACRRGRAVTRYDDVAALTLLAHDSVAAQRFALHTLAGLGQESAGKLRATVRAVLTSNGGADAVAASLGVHRNTVRYRLAQAERLIGMPVQSRPGDLLLALDYYETFLSQS
jgi:hypothetical protein